VHHPGVGREADTVVALLDAGDGHAGVDARAVPGGVAEERAQHEVGTGHRRVGLVDRVLAVRTHAREAGLKLVGGQQLVSHLGLGERHDGGTDLGAEVEASDRVQQGGRRAALKLVPECERLHGVGDVVDAVVGEPHDPAGAVAGAAVVREVELFQHHRPAAGPGQRTGGRQTGSAGPDDDDVGASAHGSDGRHASRLAARRRGRLRPSLRTPPHEFVGCLTALSR
jgi:hypothetical protein